MSAPELRAIAECPGYSASADGRIFSHWHRAGFGPLVVDMTRAPRELKQFDRRTLRNTSSPYLSVNVTRDGKRCNRFVHELVLLAWVGPRPGTPDAIEACHGPGGSRDNRLANLRWDTTKANAADRIRDMHDRAELEAPPPYVSVFDDILDPSYSGGAE